ncbi:FeoB-associated Cys-rich membrane protein [Fusibacter paucivorans]|uniref:FeoB-associated Cys-rich membrane protein n=1 Tax=Fusibacter paucivorans TaxID=76009 RepID=A0ABS5PPE4_9FIRM|nr:FeoB-associated Cys-rich membrane protein [Fusibacter paucivorans]MBS7526221.1 FeoB-associated Cys-rich membrane protein [Fusibacter paucivorans]
MANIIVFGILVLLFGSAIVYIVKAKRSGVKCIGCPHSGKSQCSCDDQVVNFKL